MVANGVVRGIMGTYLCLSVHLEGGVSIIKVSNSLVTTRGQGQRCYDLGSG